MSPVNFISAEEHQVLHKNKKRERFQRKLVLIFQHLSFAGLAISDLGCLVTIIWTNLCLNPSFNSLDLPFESVGFQYLTSGWPHATFTRVTSWITAFITLERCLCITAPLKVLQQTVSAVDVKISSNH